VGVTEGSAEADCEGPTICEPLAAADWEALELGEAAGEEVSAALATGVSEGAGVGVAASIPKFSCPPASRMKCTDCRFPGLVVADEVPASTTFVGDIAVTALDRI
jgi:hypothetical protein